MTEISNSVLDLLIIIVKNKLRLFLISFIMMILFYLGIRFFVDEKFESNVLLIPSEQESLSGIGSMLSGLKDLPFNIGGVTSSGDLAFFRTIIYSRTSVDKLINKFHLSDEFEIDTTKIGAKNDLRKAVLKMISIDENDEGAFNIMVLTKKPALSAEIANYVVDNLNSELIRMKTIKTRQNRLFLGKRLEKTKTLLQEAEDSLLYFQKKTGLYDIKNQVTEQLKAYMKFESSLMEKQLEKNILSRTLSKSNPVLKQHAVSIEEFEKKLRNLKIKGNKEGLIVSLETLPDNMLEYIRLLREVEIQGAILKFVLPLYEQTKFEEQKSMPYVQIVDNAIPAEKKSYPPRSLFTLIFGMGIFFLQLIFLFVKEHSRLKENKKYNIIKENLWKWN